MNNAIKKTTMQPTLAITN